MPPERVRLTELMWMPQGSLPQLLKAPQYQMTPERAAAVSSLPALLVAD
jgi:hypothetical protein